MVPGVVQIYRRRTRWGRKGKWAWRLIAANGNIIAGDQGQGYENKGDAERIALRIIGGHYTGARIDIEGETQ